MSFLFETETDWSKQRSLSHSSMKDGRQTILKYRTYGIFLKKLNCRLFGFSNGTVTFYKNEKYKYLGSMKKKTRKAPYLNRATCPPPKEAALSLPPLLSTAIKGAAKAAAATSNLFRFTDTMEVEPERCRMNDFAETTESSCSDAFGGLLLCPDSGTAGCRGLPSFLDSGTPGCRGSMSCPDSAKAGSHRLPSFLDSGTAGCRRLPSLLESGTVGCACPDPGATGRKHLEIFPPFSSLTNLLWVP
jgi:hypothetical protein